MTPLFHCERIEQQGAELPELSEPVAWSKISNKNCGPNTQNDYGALCLLDVYWPLFANTVAIFSIKMFATCCPLSVLNIT